MSKGLFSKSVGLLIITTIFTWLFYPSPSLSWGFYGHKKINRMAVFTLPPDMIGFYKKHIEYITEHGTDPDKRCFSDENEACRHYIDIDHYGENCFDSVPKRWKDAVAKYSEDTLKKYGINPWWTEKMFYRLVQAFKDRNKQAILYISANLGHYIADGNTPLHTTQYYDGKNPEQKGIHAFWESRIPELFGDNYNFFVGQAEYIEKPSDKIWEYVKQSHQAIDTIFMAQEVLRASYPDDKKYAIENRGAATVKVISKDYSYQFSLMIAGMVERQMRKAVKMVGSLWYTAWVNAGQPDLKLIEDKTFTDSLKKEEEETERMWKTGKPKGRPNPE